MFILSGEKETILAISKSIDIDPESVDLELSREIFSEMGNLTAGRASAMLSQKGIKTNITPPSIFCGAGSQIFSMVPDLYCSEVITEHGLLKVHSAIRQREKATVYVS